MMKLVELNTISRFNPSNNSYYDDMDGDGVLCMAVDILPTEFAKEASQHFGDILSGFVGSLASMTEISDLPAHLKRACISYRGELTSLYEYIPRMRKSNPEYVLLRALLHLKYLGLFSKLCFHLYPL
jgi:alpha-aminoadipic semialdehyde synthase